MTTSPEPGERRSPESRAMLDRPPGDRYIPAERGPTRSAGRFDEARAPLTVAAGGVVAYVVLGGVLAVTAGLIVLAGLIGWLIGLFVRPPARAALVAVATAIVGLIGIWLFGRWEGGVLNPIDYFADVQGIVVPLELLAAGGMAAAASR